MSAYLCNTQHIGALAAFTCSGRSVCALHEWQEVDKVDTAKRVAVELATQNVLSLEARYPSDTSGNRPGPIIESDEAYLSECADYAATYMYKFTGLTPLDIISMSKCYEYQSCETDNWSDTLACRQIDWIIGEALRQLPGYDDAIRDYDGKIERMPAW